MIKITFFFQNFGISWVKGSVAIAILMKSWWMLLNHYIISTFPRQIWKRADTEDVHVDAWPMAIHWGRSCIPSYFAVPCPHWCSVPFPAASRWPPVVSSVPLIDSPSVLSCLRGDADRWASSPPLLPSPPPPPHATASSQTPAAPFSSLHPPADSWHYCVPPDDGKASWTTTKCPPGGWWWWKRTCEVNGYDKPIIVLASIKDAPFFFPKNKTKKLECILDAECCIIYKCNLDLWEVSTSDKMLLLWWPGRLITLAVSCDDEETLTAAVIIVWCWSWSS